MSERAILQIVGRYAWRVPPEVVMRIAGELERLETLEAADIARVAASVHDPGVRQQTTLLLSRWRESAAGHPSRLAALLNGAGEAVSYHQQTESSQLVWTGPASPHATFRRTDEALLEVVRAAQRVLTLVTFAAYRVPDVRDALKSILDRGVEVRFVGEREEGSAGQLRFDAALALGEELAKRSMVLEWPRELRLRDPRGSVGKLHAKCALADDSLLLVSSANLTEAGLGINMEMGILLRGGPVPSLAARHFDDLMRTGTLRPAEASGGRG